MDPERNNQAQALWIPKGITKRRRCKSGETENPKITIANRPSSAAPNPTAPNSTAPNPHPAPPNPAGPLQPGHQILDGPSRQRVFQRVEFSCPLPNAELESSHRSVLCALPTLGRGTMLLFGYSETGPEQVLKLLEGLLQLLERLWDRSPFPQGRAAFRTPHSGRFERRPGLFFLCHLFSSILSLIDARRFPRVAG